MPAATNYTAAEVARKYPGLCARMWKGTGCTALGNGECRAFTLGHGVCLLGPSELETMAREYPAPKARG